MPKGRRFKVSMPHAALLVVQAGSIHLIRGLWSCFNAARGFVGGARYELPTDQYGFLTVSMPHAALFVVQVRNLSLSAVRICVSMPHAALFVVQEPSL